LNPTHVHYLIASHHGRQELGGAVAPMTLEAEILHYADNASAKSASMALALADAGDFEGGRPADSARGPAARSASMPRP